MNLGIKEFKYRHLHSCLLDTHNCLLYYYVHWSTRCAMLFLVLECYASLIDFLIILPSKWHVFCLANIEMALVIYIICCISLFRIQIRYHALFTFICVDFICTLFTLKMRSYTLFPFEVMFYFSSSAVFIHPQK